MVLFLFFFFFEVIVLIDDDFFSFRSKKPFVKASLPLLGMKSLASTLLIGDLLVEEKLLFFFFP